MEHDGLEAVDGRRGFRHHVDVAGGGNGHANTVLFGAVKHRRREDDETEELDDVGSSPLDEGVLGSLGQDVGYRRLVNALVGDDDGGGDNESSHEERVFERFLDDGDDGGEEVFGTTRDTTRSTRLARWRLRLTRRGSRSGTTRLIVSSSSRHG